MSRKRQKTPKSNYSPKQEKIPRIREDVSNYLKLNPSWQIGRLDEGGEWGWNLISDSLLKNEILPKIKNFESRTWADIFKDNNHEVSVYQIHKTAQKRLDELRLNDIESLVSLRLTGQKRVWGIRNVSVFRILWWDPKHTVYPSKKKHT